MNLPGLSVRNPVAVNLVMLAVIVMGAYAGVTLTREFFPQIEVEQILVSVPYPGATPEEVEKSVTRLVEREVEDVDGLDRIESRVYEGLTVIALELEEGADRDRVLNDVRGEIDKVVPDLPDGAEEPEITEARPQIPVIALVLYGDVPETTLHEAILQVRDDLLDLDEVTNLVITGWRDREILVEIRPERLEQYGLTFEDVGTRLARSNLDVPGGQLKGGLTNIRVRTLGEEQVGRRLEDLVVRTRPDGSAIRLRDIAVVREGFEDKVIRGRFRAPHGSVEAARSPGPGQRAASLTVFKDPDQDAIEIANAVKAYAAHHPSMAGGAIDVTVTTDLARFIEQRLDLMRRNAIMGLIFVLITLAVFLELRIAFWVMAGLIFSFAGTFLLMKLVGESINLISLFGLIVVLGMIVDDAIVIGENIFSKMRRGIPPLRAAEDGANEVGGPVLAAVLTTCVAFLPLAFIGGRMGNFLGVLPVVVICALGASLLEAFYVLPSHLAHAPRKPNGRFARAYARFNEAKHTLFEEILPGVLERQLRWHLRWRYVTMAAALVVLLVAAGLVAGGRIPFVLLQQTDAETITAKVEMAAGTPEEETLRVLEKAEAAAAAQPEVSTVFTVLGTSFGDRGPEVPADAATVGQLVLELKPAESRQAEGLRTSPALLAELRRLTSGIPGVKRLSWTGRSGGPGGVDIEILVRGDDLATVQKAVQWTEDRIAEFQGIDEIYDDLDLGKLEVQLRLRPDARTLGLTTSDLALQVRHALFGFEAQDLQIGDEEVTVRVMLPEPSRRSMADLARLRFRTPIGSRVPLQEVAEIATGRGYASLTRVDGKRAVTVSAEVDEDVQNVANVTNSLRRSFEGLAMVGEGAGRHAEKRQLSLAERFPGVGYQFEGTQKETRESMTSLFIGFPAALLGIFSIIAIVFRSYAQPVIVMLVIPFALVGAIVGHLVMGYPFTLLSMIGAVALSGIVVNDGLILVDFANRRRREGEGAFEAVVQAAKSRLRPILLTSITTIAGLAPLMLERSFQAQFLIPMAISIVFGLAFGTALTLLLLPTAYLIFEDVRMAVRWTWTGRYTDELSDVRREADLQAGAPGDSG